MEADGRPGPERPFERGARGPERPFERGARGPERPFERGARASDQLPGNGAGFLDLEEAARLAGHSRWLEARLFEILGAWVAAEPDPEVKLALAAQSMRHGGHVEVWRRLQPRVAHLDPGSLTVAAGPGAAALVDELAATTGPGQTVERLVSQAEVVLPALVAGYRARLAAAHPLADGPTVRGLRAVVAEELDALGECRRLLERRLGDTGLRERSEGHRARLAALLAEDAGLLGVALAGKT